MAKAPTPGTSRRIAVSEMLTDELDKWIRVVCPAEDIDVTLYLRTVGPKDDDVCKAQTGHETWELWSDFISTPTGWLVAYWMARRKNGEPQLPFKKIWKQYPTLADIQASGMYIDISDPDGDQADDDDIEERVTEGPAITGPTD